MQRISRSRQRARFILTAAVLASSLCATAHAVDLYWDNNGTTGGVGGGPGNWLDANRWSTALAGTDAAAWVADSTAIFAGTASTVTVNGPVSAAGLSFSTNNYTFAGANTLTLSGLTPTIKLNDTNIAGGFTSVGNAPISAANEVQVTKGTGTGIHQLTLNNSGNTFSGGIRIPSVNGNIRFNIQSTGSLGSGAGAGSITVQGTNTVFSTLTSGPAGTVTVANPFVLSSGIDVGFSATGGSTTLDFTGQISGAANVIVDSAPTNNGPDGGGITVFSNASNSYTGSLIICNLAASGVVRIGAQGAVPTGIAVVLGRGLGTAGTDIGLLDLNGTPLSIASLATNLAGGNTAKGITNSNSSFGGSISITGSSTTTYASTIGAGANNTNMTSATDNLSLTLTSGHSGTLTLSGNNTYTGNTTVQGGTLNIANTTGNGLASPVIVSGGTVNVQNSGGNGIVNNVTVSSGTMTVRNTAGVGVVGNASVSGGTLNAGLATSGTFVTGNVTVSGTGTLGSAAGTRLGTVATITGDVTVNSGGTVSPAGAGVGTLKPNNLFVNNNGKLSFSLSSISEYDLIDLGSGALTLDSGTHTIDITGTPTAGNSFTLLTYGSRIWDNTNQFSLGSTPAGFNYSLTQTGDSVTPGSVILNVTALTPSLVWDVGGGGLPITDGDGVWTDGSGNFYDTTGAAAATFANANNYDVTFGSSAGNNGGVVTFSGNIHVGGKLIFGPISGTPFYQLGLVGSTETLTTSSNGILASSSGDIEAPVTLEASQTWTTSSGATLTVAGAISGSGISLTKGGDGTLLVTSNAASIGTLSSTLGTTTLSGNSHVIGTLDVSGGSATLSGSGHNITTVNVSAGTLTLSGSTNTLGAISVSGGTADVTGSANTVTSASISGGSLVVATDTALGSAPISISNNATLRTSASVNLSNAISVASTGGTASVDTSMTSTFSGNVTGAGALTKSGAGALVLTGTNTMNGLSITAGTLVAASDANLGSGGLSIGNTAALRPSASFSTSKTITQIGATSSRFDVPSGLTLTLAGNISGSIALAKDGTGTVVLSGSNGGMSGQIQFVAGTGGGVIETLTSNALGSGALFPFSNGTLRTTNDLTLNVVRGGTGINNIVLTKEGAGKLTVTGTTNSSNFNDGTAIVVNAGSVQMDSHTGLGGYNGSPTTVNQMPITMNSGTELIVNWATTIEPRYSRNITLNDATVTRVNGAGSGTLGLAEFTTHASTSVSKNGVLGITGSSLIRNQEASGTSLKHLQFQMPVNIANGATLTLSSANSTGDYHNTRVILRGPATAANMPTDALTLEAGATLVATGTGEKSIGGPGTNLNQGHGLPIVGKGTPGSEATLKLDTHTLLTDRNAGGASPASITKLLVTGSGDAGLRVEAPMNATYTVPNPGGAPANRTYDGTTGLFGVNTTTTFDTTAIPAGYVAIGNNYTVMSPKRVNALSDTFIGSISAPVTLGGTLTLAATDATTPAAGTLSTGPTVAVPIRLAFDNTVASAGANLVYQIDGAADSARFSNFAGLDVKRSNSGAGSVKVKLVNSVTKVPDVTITGGTRLDVNDQKLALTNMSAGSFDGTNYTGVHKLVKDGRNSTAVTAPWNGSGIMTSQTDAIAPSALTGLAVATAGDVGKTTFGGVAVNPTDALVMYTYNGDANLSGNVDADDYFQIDSNYNKPSVGMTWNKGDFNYDGVINGDDFFMIDQAFVNQGSPIAGGAALGAGGITGVPEPASCAVMLLASYLCSRRRRHRDLQ
jgi:fibronectin-binding autotransporter adhesin